MRKLKSRIFQKGFYLLPLLCLLNSDLAAAEKETDANWKVVKQKIHSLFNDPTVASVSFSDESSPNSCDLLDQLAGSKIEEFDCRFAVLGRVSKDIYLLAIPSSSGAYQSNYRFRKLDISETRPKEAAVPFEKFNENSGKIEVSQSDELLGSLSFQPDGKIGHSVRGSSCNGAESEYKFSGEVLRLITSTEYDDCDEDKVNKGICPDGFTFKKTDPASWMPQCTKVVFKASS